MRRALPLLAALWLGFAPALAQEVQLADPKLEQRARDLSREIRCVVCQSQAVSDSDADIARELRAMIREQIAVGKSDQEIRDFLVARYGDFVLFDPPFKASTYVLWIGPFAILVLAAIGVALFFRRRAEEPAHPRALSADEHSRVERLLRNDGTDDIGARGGGA
jgi:cytochrome c-type biogenesis protein CcmH